MISSEKVFRASGYQTAFVLLFVILAALSCGQNEDAANNTVSWSVSSQPWHDGDKLMLRIRES